MLDLEDLGVAISDSYRKPAPYLDDMVPYRFEIERSFYGSWQTTRAKMWELAEQESGDAEVPLPIVMTLGPAEGETEESAEERMTSFRYPPNYVRRFRMNVRSFAESASTSSEVLLLMSRDPYRDPDRGLHSSNSGDVDVVGVAIDHPNMPVPRLVQMCRDVGSVPSGRVRWLFSNPRLPVSVLEELIGGKTLIIRGALGREALIGVASNESTPEDLLRRLYEQRPTASVRRHVAANPSTPPDVLDQLLADSDAETRYASGRNPNLSVGSIRETAVHKNWRMREAVAQNDSSPSAVLKHLQQDTSTRVKSAAKGTLACRVLGCRTGLLRILPGRPLWEDHSAQHRSGILHGYEIDWG